jgi:hypothetical protein
VCDFLIILVVLDKVQLIALFHSVYVDGFFKKLKKDKVKLIALFYSVYIDWLLKQLKNTKTAG